MSEKEKQKDLKDELIPQETTFEETGLDSEDDLFEPSDNLEDSDLDSNLDDESSSEPNVETNPTDNFISIQESEEDVNTKEKVKRSIYVTRQTLNSIEQLAKLRNVSGSKIVEFAIALYFKNYFERDFIQISDLSIYIEEFATLTGALTNEAGHLGEIGSRILDAEMELPTEL